MGTNMPFQGVSGPELLGRALGAMQAEGLVVRARSSVWRTEAWPPGADQPDYFNAIVEADSADLTPQALYATLRLVETHFGRERRERWAPRTLDLDIVAMDGWVGSFDGIELPHPRMQERAFVLAPFAEAGPGWVHPISGQSPSELLATLPSGGRYQRVSALGAPEG